MPVPGRELCFDAGHRDFSLAWRTRALGMSWRLRPPAQELRTTVGRDTLGRAGSALLRSASSAVLRCANSCVSLCHRLRWIHARIWFARLAPQQIPAKGRPRARRCLNLQLRPTEERAALARGSGLRRVAASTAAPHLGWIYFAGCTSRCQPWFSMQTLCASSPVRMRVPPST